VQFIKACHVQVKAGKVMPMRQMVENLGNKKKKRG
jgi:hypothetical protein